MRYLIAITKYATEPMIATRIRELSDARLIVATAKGRRSLRRLARACSGLTIGVCICNYMSVSNSATFRLADEMGRSCLNMRARIASRVVTGIYDDELRPLGIQASQLNLLVAVAGMGPVRRTDVGRYMHLDASTLTRNLRVMETNGWIEEIAEPSDGRGSPIRITTRAEALIAKAAPAWRSAQRKASNHLGKDGTAALLQLAAAIKS